MLDLDNDALRPIPVYPTAADSRRRFAARADDGFYRAAQYGLAAQLSWPAGGRDRIRALPAPQLVAELIPAAMQGLLTAGVVSAEAEGLLEVISRWAAAAQTGAVWQRATLANLERGRDRHHALAEMFGRYLQHADTAQPVHTWPIGD